MFNPYNNFSFTTQKVLATSLVQNRSGISIPKKVPKFFWHSFSFLRAEERNYDLLLF